MATKKRKMTKNKKIIFAFIVVIILVLLFSVVGVWVLYLGWNQGIAPTNTVDLSDVTIIPAADNGDVTIVPSEDSNEQPEEGIDIILPDAEAPWEEEAPLLIDGEVEAIDDDSDDDTVLDGDEDDTDLAADSEADVAAEIAVEQPLEDSAQ